MATKQPKQPTGKLAVIYARYSSHNQRDVSIEQQVNACRKYAADHELEVIRVYDDHAMTGTNDNRPEFQRMIRDSATGAFSYVIVYALDRFSRDRYDSAIHKHTLKENGVKVLSAMENITDDPTGVLMESILEGFAEYYSKELSQKIRRGYRSNAEKGLVIGPLPFGYRKGEDGRYEIHPQEGPIVKEIFQRVSMGEPFADIFRDLNDRGIPTKRGKPWDRTSFTKLLHNERYIGIYQFEDIRIEGGVPAIIDKPLFDMVQEYCTRKKNPRNAPEKRRRENGVYLLTGKLYCGECKAPMIGVSGTGRNGLHYYYVCKNRRHDKNACHKKQVTRDFAEELVTAELKKIISSKEVVEWLADGVIRFLKESQENDEIELLKQKLTAVNREKENTLKAIRMGVIAVSVQKMLEGLEAEADSLAAKIAIEQDKARTDITREHVIAWIETFQEGDVTDKDFQEQLIDAFLVRAYLYDNHLRMVFTYTGENTNEIDVPFDIDAVDSEAIDSIDLTDCAADSQDSVRIGETDLHSSHLIRTIPRIYLIAGMFVLVTNLAAQR